MKRVAYKKQAARRNISIFRRFRWAFVLAGILVIIAIIAICYHVSQDHAKSAATTKPKAVAGGSQYSTTPLNSEEVNQPNESRKDASQPSPTLNSTSSQNQSIQVAITRVSTNPSKVFTQVFGTTSGTCTMTATHDGQPTVTATSDVAASVNSYVCKDFGLASNQFASGGWHIVVTLTSNGTTVDSDPWDVP